LDSELQVDGEVCRRAGHAIISVFLLSAYSYSRHLSRFKFVMLAPPPSPAGIAQSLKAISRLPSNLGANCRKENYACFSSRHQRIECHSQLGARDASFVL
jgi:hypothetical protein